jgi:hypothetical protein
MPQTALRGRRFFWGFGEAFRLCLGSRWFFADRGQSGQGDA